MNAPQAVVITRLADAEYTSALAVRDAARVNVAQPVQLQASLAEAEAKWKPRLEKLEKDRVEAIAKAKDALAGYEAELAPRLAEAEKQRQAQIAKADADLKKYEAEVLPGKLTEFEKKQRTAVDWVRLNPKTLTAMRTR